MYRVSGFPTGLCGRNHLPVCLWGLRLARSTTQNPSVMERAEAGQSYRVCIDIDGVSGAGASEMIHGHKDHLTFPLQAVSQATMSLSLRVTHDQLVFWFIASRCRPSGLVFTSMSPFRPRSRGRVLGGSNYADGDAGYLVYKPDTTASRNEATDWMEKGVPLLFPQIFGCSFLLQDCSHIPKPAPENWKL